MMVWMIIMWTTLVVTCISLFYLSRRVTHFFFMEKISFGNAKIKSALGVVAALGAFAITGMALNFVNAIVCAFYFAIIWAICDAFFFLVGKIFKIEYKSYCAGEMAIILSFAALGYGWYLNHNVWKTEYTIKTKKIKEPLKIAMLADSHLGTTFDTFGFIQYLEEIERQNPDILVVVGDYVDDNSTLKDMLDANVALGRFNTKYGVYFVLGNHDKGYYGATHRGFSGAELVENLKKNNINVLFDETVLVNDEFYIIGRRDFSEERKLLKNRKSMDEIMDQTDKDKYSIVLDHQPTDYRDQEEAGVDLVLSGHTHGGQLFPFNQFGKFLGANDLVYGHEKRGDTDFIVTSGISDWAVQFKTGTKSEYVIINLLPEIGYGN